MAGRHARSCGTPTRTRLDRNVALPHEDGYLNMVELGPSYGASAECQVRSEGSPPLLPPHGTGGRQRHTPDRAKGSKGGEHGPKGGEHGPLQF